MYYPPLFCNKTGSSSGPELTKQSKLSLTHKPTFDLSLSPHHWDYKCVLSSPKSLTWALEFNLRSSCLQEGTLCQLTHLPCSSIVTTVHTLCLYSNQTDLLTLLQIIHVLSCFYSLHIFLSASKPFLYPHLVFNSEGTFYRTPSLYNWIQFHQSSSHLTESHYSPIVTKQSMGSNFLSLLSPIFRMWTYMSIIWMVGTENISL